MTLLERIVPFVALAAVLGCAGEDSCEEAYRKLEECGIKDSGEPRACQSDQEECAAKCTVQASCEDIMNVLEDSDYAQCLAACK